jgi:hypothetical protein
MTIARLWTGATRDTDADAYLAYLRRTGLQAYRATPGNRGAMCLRRLEPGRCQFLLISLWDSWEAVRRFAGPDGDRAVFYPEDDRFLVDRELVVRHFEVADGAEEWAVRHTRALRDILGVDRVGYRM